MKLTTTTTTILLSTLGTTSAYLAQVNNAHVEFLSSNEAAATTTVDLNTDKNIDVPEAEQEQQQPALLEVLATVDLLGFHPTQIIEEFEGWMDKFGREYEDLNVKGKKMLVWLENHALIETHNAKPNQPFTLGHNDYSDLTHEEFRKRMFLGEYSPGLMIEEGREFKFADFSEDAAVGGGTDGTSVDVNAKLRGTASASAVDEEVVATERRRLDDTTTPTDEHDWATMGLLGPIRNQGICGACWAFSSIGAIESAMAIQKYNKMTPNEKAERWGAVGVDENGGVRDDLGLVVPLSEQDLIDCDTLYEKGCDGGLMTTTFEEEKVKKGICSEVDYPYTQSQGTCSYDMCTPVEGSIVKDQIDIVPRKTNALKEAIKKQPVTAAMVASDPMFQFYSSGIYTVKDCGKVTKQFGEEDCQKLYQGQDTCLPDINHGVLVVGYGTDQTATTDVKGYFKVKNSWGEAWGESGYFRLARYEEDPTDPMTNWGECAILTLLSAPVMG
jgi:hypothetical protein